MNQEAIIEHGYTGVIDEAHIKEIIKSIIISIVMKRIVYLKEFMKGLCLFDLATLVNTYPEVCEPLFVGISLYCVPTILLFCLVLCVTSLFMSKFVDEGIRTTCFTSF